MTAVIEAKGLARWYGQVVGVNDVDAVVGPGITGLLGLSLNAHPNRFTVGGVTLSTWRSKRSSGIPVKVSWPTCPRST